MVTAVMGGLGQQPTGAESLDRVRRRWASDPYVQLLGLEIVDFGPGRARLRSDDPVASGGALLS